MLIVMIVKMIAAVMLSLSKAKPGNNHNNNINNTMQCCLTFLCARTLSSDCWPCLSKCPVRENILLQVLPSGFLLNVIVNVVVVLWLCFQYQPQQQTNQRINNSRNRINTNNCQQLRAAFVLIVTCQTTRFGLLELQCYCIYFSTPLKLHKLCNLSFNFYVH